MIFKAPILCHDLQLSDSSPEPLYSGLLALSMLQVTAR